MAHDPWGNGSTLNIAFGTENPPFKRWCTHFHLGAQAPLSFDGWISKSPLLWMNGVRVLTVLFAIEDEMFDANMGVFANVTAPRSCSRVDFVTRDQHRSPNTGHGRRIADRQNVMQARHFDKQLTVLLNNWWLDKVWTNFWHMSKFCPIFVHVLSKFCQCPIFVKIIEILLGFVKFLSMFCPKNLFIVQVLSTVS